MMSYSLKILRFWNYSFVILQQLSIFRLIIGHGGLGTTFTGDTYIYNAFPKAYISWSSEILLIEFKTMQKDAILFYSGDIYEMSSTVSFHSLMIYVDNFGEIIYNFTRSKVNGDRIMIIKVKNKYGGRFDDNQWHQMKFMRSLNKVSNGFEMTINIKEDDTDLSTKTFPVLSLFEKTRFLSIAGVSSDIADKRKFSGCLYKVIYKADNIQLDVLQLTQKRLHGFLEVGRPILYSQSCQSVNGLLGSVSLLSSTSLIVLKTRSESYSTIDLIIEFSAQTDSFVLYFQKAKDTNDYLSIEARSSQLVIGVVYHSNQISWYVPNCQIYINRRHMLRLFIDFVSGHLKVNYDDYHMEKHLLGTSTSVPGDGMVSFGTEIFIGGGRHSLYSSKHFTPSVWMASLQKGFKGCVLRVILNDETFDLERSIMTISDKDNKIMKGCLGYNANKSICDNDLSNTHYCHNGGQCEDNWPMVTCNCDLTNYEGEKCDEGSRVIFFDGSSFVRLDLGTEFYTEAESVFIRFKTSYNTGYLFSTMPSESSDLQFQSMQFHIIDSMLTFDIQYNERKLTFKLTANVSDNEWHSVKVSRYHHSLSLDLDGSILQQAIVSNESILTWQSINIAASLHWADNYQTKPFSPKIWVVRTRLNSDSNLYQNFVGSINKFKINNIDLLNDYLLQIQNPQSIWTVYSDALLDSSTNYTTLFPVIFHTHYSYMTISKLYLYDSFSLSFLMKTFQKSGLLFMASGLSNDFLLLELVQGDIRLSFSMGSSVQTIEGHRGVIDGGLADNRWHSVELSRHDLLRNAMVLLVDGKVVEELIVDNGHKTRNFNFNNPSFLGGLPSTEFLKWRDKIISNFGFQGCISGFKLNGKKAFNLLQDPLVDIPEYFKSQISQGCDKNVTVCLENYCQNGGYCLQQWDRPKCDCRYTTFEGERCTRVSTTLKFKRQVASYNYLLLKYKDRSRNTSRDDIALGLQTNKTDGTILSVESRNREKGDFMHLYLENGKLVFEYDMGAGQKRLTDHSSQVSDGFYRRVRIRRSGPSSWLQIDNSRSELESKDSKTGKYFNEQTYIWIGANPGSKDPKQFEGSISGLMINGIDVPRVLQNKERYAHLQISSVGEVLLEIKSDIKPTSNSNFVLNEIENEKPISGDPSKKTVCVNGQNDHCPQTNKVTKENPLKRHFTSTLESLPTLSIDGADTSFFGLDLSKTAYIVIVSSVSFVIVIISVLVLCRCFRKRGDRGSYNLTEADKFSDGSPVIVNRPSLQAPNTPPIFKDDLELSPLSKSSKTSDVSSVRLLNGGGINGNGSVQSITTYIPKQAKELERKKKEVKEWYV